MNTHAAYKACVVCGRPLAVEIAYAAGYGPAGAEVDVMPEQSNIADIACAHAPDLLLWLSTDEGTAWCAARVDEARIEGALT